MLSNSVGGRHFNCRLLLFPVLTHFPVPNFASVDPHFINCVANLPLRYSLSSPTRASLSCSYILLCPHSSAAAYRLVFPLRPGSLFLPSLSWVQRPTWFSYFLSSTRRPLLVILSMSTLITPWSLNKSYPFDSDYLRDFPAPVQFVPWFSLSSFTSCFWSQNMSFLFLQSFCRVFS